MSTGRQPSLHLEWTPEQVRAIDIATGKTATATRIADLGPILSGHRDALVGVGRGQVFLKTVRLPKAAHEDLRRVLTVQIGTLFPLPPDQLAFDFFQSSDHNAEGFLTLVAGVRSEDLGRLREELNQAGIRRARILPSALAAPALAHSARLSDALVFESAPGGVALDVVMGGVLRFSRVVPAEENMTPEAQRTLAAAGAGPLPWVAAGSVPVSDVVTRTASSLERLHEAPPFSFERQEDRIRAEQKRISTKTRFAVLMAMAAVLLATLLWVERSDAQAVVTKAQGTWTKDLSKLRSIRDTDTTKAQYYGTMRATLKAALQPTQPLSDIVSVVGDMLPPSIWLNGLNVERGKPVQIRGTATVPNDVARFVDALGASPRFRDVRLVFANSARIEETPVVQFSITAVAVGNLPMPSPPKKSGKTARGAKSTGTTGTTAAGGTGASGTTQEVK